MTLFDAEPGREYTVSAIKVDDEELIGFLFSLGCYAGEPITVITRHKKTLVVAIKDGRYCIDSALARTIII